MSVYIYSSKKELYHHGIIGQRWGVRRYQNPDGSLTDEGQRRYSTGIRGRIKKKQESKLSKLKRDDADLDAKSDDLFWKYYKMDRKADAAYNKVDRIESKAENLHRKAVTYSMKKNTDPANYSKKHEDDMFDEAGMMQYEADKLQEEADVKKALAEEARKTWREVDDVYKENKAKLEKQANKYIKKYGQIEYDKIN